jgi:serine/threonine-protein kinase
MDLDEIKQQWEEYDRKLNDSIRLNPRLLSAMNLNRAHSSLQRMVFYLGVEAALWLAGIVFIGRFIYENGSAARFLASGVAVDVFVIAMLATTIAQIALIQRIDYGKPVAAIQKQMEGLRVLRIKTVRWGLVAGTVVWAPFIILICKAFLGVASLSAAWLWTNVALGLSLIPLTWWLSKEFGDKMQRFPFIQRLMHDIGGRSLNAAASFLATISEFERE